MPLKPYLLALVLTLLAGPARADPTVLVIATSELPPYVSANAKDSFLTELLPEVGKEMGVTFQFRFMPWPRCEIAVDELQAWASMPYVRTPERDQKFLFSEPLYAKRTVLFYYSPTNQGYPRTFATLGDLKRYKMGGVRSYYYEALFAEAGMILELAGNEESSFKKLRAGRVDMVPAVDVVGWDVIRKTFPPEERENFHVLDTPLAVGHNHLMTSRNYPQAELLMERFNQALAKVRRNGVYKQVAERQGLVVKN
jgi:polar amino acid transport system substrate-binding protein